MRYTVNRTAIIDAFFMDMKAGYVRTFRWEEFEPVRQGHPEYTAGGHRGRSRREQACLAAWSGES